MPAEMGHVSLVSREAFTAVVTSEGKISGVTTLVSDQLVAITELLLTVVTSIPGGRGNMTVNHRKQIVFSLYLLVSL